MIAGSFPGASIWLEGSTDAGVTWAPLVAFSGKGGLVSFVDVAGFYRVNVQNRKAAFAAVCAIAAANDPLTPGAGGTQVFTYVATGLEGSDFFIVLPVARPDDDYVPQVTCGGVTAILGVDCPDLAAGDRTTTQFRVVTSAAVQAGDLFDVTVEQRT